MAHVLPLRYTMKQQTIVNRGNIYGKKKRSLLGVIRLFPVFFFFAFFLPCTALPGTERFTLEYGDGQFRGHRDGTRIYLKKTLKEHYAEVDVSSYRLRKVILVAWSKNTTASVQLRVGPEMSSIYNVDRRKPERLRKGGHSHTSIAIENPFYESWGPWQLLLHGDIALRQVVLEVEKRDPG